jgi:uncharacterized damage-inducible protein DinB
MKTIFQALAKYNGNVNLEITGFLEGMPAEKLTNRTKAYFPTIQDAVFHIFLSDLGMFRRFKAAFPESKAINSSALLSADTAVIKKEVEADLKKFFQYRRDMDFMITQFMDELTDEKLESPLKYVNYKGESVETVVWKMLLTIFNHQTHHRGGISVMLDMADVKNDFSGTLARI